MYNVRSFEEPSHRVRRKLVIVGDGGCGKTSLLMVQSGLEFPTDYVPTIFENYISRVQVKNTLVELSLWDTAGQEEYDRLRPLSYPDTDVVVMTFSVDSRDTYYNISERWFPEIRHFLTHVPLILVGTKVDLRDKIVSLPPTDPVPTKGIVTTEMGQHMAKEIGALKYFECSAKEDINIAPIFQFAAKQAIKNGKRRKHGDCKLF